MTALTPERLSEIEVAARYGIDMAHRGWRECPRLSCFVDPEDPTSALITIPPDEEVHSAKWGLWARWFAAEEIDRRHGWNRLRVRPRADRPTEPEAWEVDDIVADAEGGIWTRTDNPDWPWNHGAEQMKSGNHSGTAEEARLLRPVLLLVRDGKPVGRVR